LRLNDQTVRTRVRLANQRLTNTITQIH
jgi:hypothetical protein